jgi:hypothetical protein
LLNVNVYAYTYINNSYLNISKHFLQEMRITQIREDLNFEEGNGPCNVTVEQQLNSLNVHRQAYHGGDFVGNHVDICLKVP